MSGVNSHIRVPKQKSAFGINAGLIHKHIDKLRQVALAAFARFDIRRIV